MNQMEDRLVAEVTELRGLLRMKEAELANLRRKRQIEQKYGLDNDEIHRYSRQLLLPEVGVQGQKKLKDSSVLVVGAGGLGCPAVLYLACAGIGRIGIVDYDVIEVNNLHRQSLYTEGSIGTSKVTAVAEFVNRLNSYVKIIPYKIQLNSDNATSVIQKYDIVVDATDNIASRYLLNDACVILGKPLVFGAALKFEGHLSVFNHNGPCFRCIHPNPPAPETVTTCGEGGIMGAVVGTIGILQALEAIKIILDMPDTLSGRLLVFDGVLTKFFNIRLRPKNPNCPVCGECRVISELIDYEKFCGVTVDEKGRDSLTLLNEEERITVEEYDGIVKADTRPHVLVDVRPVAEYQICSLKNSLNIPFADIRDEKRLKVLGDSIKAKQQGVDPVNLYVLCRRGNDSQKAVRFLKEQFREENVEIKDLIGGIYAWTDKIDQTFPRY